MSAFWQRTNTLLLALLLLAALGIIAMLAVRAEGGPLDPANPPGPTDSVRLPGTPITGQTTISTPGHYYLTRNITVPGAVTAITIAASNVSLDLGGFTIAGNDTVGSAGIGTSGGIHNVEIIHGTVRDFHTGLITGINGDAQIDDVVVTSNIRGFDIGGTWTTLSNCTAKDNTETGLYVPGLDNVVRDCSIVHNAGDGIALAGFPNVIERSWIDNNGFGDTNLYRNLRIAGGSSTIRENTVMGSFRIESGGNYLLNNVCLLAIQDVSGNPGSTLKSGNMGC